MPGSALYHFGDHIDAVPGDSGQICLWDDVEGGEDRFVDGRPLTFEFT